MLIKVEGLGARLVLGPHGVLQYIPPSSCKGGRSGMAGVAFATPLSFQIHG